MSDVAFVIGRFQPYHKGHHALIHRAFQCADHVVVIVGDTGCRPDFRNPWTFEEREEWLQAIWTQEMSEHQHMSIVQVEDIPYDDAAWVKSVQAAVARFTAAGKGRRTLVGHKKDASSFYLSLFPEWEFVEVAPQHGISATGIRELFFAGDFNRVANILAPQVAQGILHMPVQRYSEIAKECKAIAEHDAEWACIGSGAYGTQHVTVDVLLRSPKYVLLIERGGDVGGGAWALPGGFVNADERLLEAALRELEEETDIRLERSDFPVNGIGSTVAFDHPRRSMRGRIFTNVLYAVVEDSMTGEMTPKASDDARHAFWLPIADLKANKRKFFSDHYHIINYFLGE